MILSRSSTFVGLFLYAYVVLCSQDSHSSDEEYWDSPRSGNVSLGEPIVLTGDPGERRALVDEIYNMDIQNRLQGLAQKAASLCGDTTNTTITTHFESSNAITFKIHVREEDERYSLAYNCLLDNYKNSHVIVPINGNVTELSAEENCEAVREMLSWINMAELRVLQSLDKVREK